MISIKKIFACLMITACVFTSLSALAIAQAQAKNWHCDENDQTVLRTLHNELTQLTGSLTFIGPEFTTATFHEFSLTLTKTGQKGFDIVGASFNGLDVLSKIKTREWEKDGKKYVEVRYNVGYKTREGVHYFMVKYQYYNGISASAVLIVQEKKGENADRQANRFIVDPRVPKIFGKLYKTQQKLKSFSARLTGHFEDYGTTKADVMMDFVGKITAMGWDKFFTVLADLPTYTIKQGGKTQTSHNENWQEYFPSHQVIDRNHLGAFNLVYYLDYLAILDNYNWEIKQENAQELVLWGYANELQQQPYQYLIKVDKKRWLPLMVQTYLDGETVINFAEVKYKTISKIDVPIKQVTTSIFKRKILQEYTLDLSQEIEINKIPVERSGGI